MTKAIFQKKIICKHCNGYFKRKKYRNKFTYVCSKADNFQECERVPIDESIILQLLRGRYGELPDEALANKVERIIIEDRLLLEIFLIDQENIKFSRNHIVF